MEHNGRIAYATIVAAKAGDTEAICEILRHYERYICHFAKRTVYDADGYSHNIIDDNRRKQIEAEYLTALWLHYDIHRLPKGETLEAQ
ncbi:helix-turn-helix domain-containing protein [Evtepia gabavorous]|uniref:helix-turn-helix domain-containing protein n=1 Tax=Evtepia gabavorous TaxID=2211183 RepID=UPI003A8D0DD7